MTKKESKAKQEEDTAAVVFPLPGDRDNRPLVTVTTDAQGKFSIPVRIIKPGRYTLRFRFPGDEKYAPAEATRAVMVLPDTSSKGAIKLENARLRASIRSSTDLEVIQETEKWSQAISRLAPPNLRKYALKEYEKTSRLVAKRIEQLRLTESSFGLNVSKSGFSVKKETKKESVGIQ